MVIREKERTGIRTRRPRICIVTQANHPSGTLPVSDRARDMWLALIADVLVKQVMEENRRRDASCE